ncbi:MAG TPA: helix-turn-helix domain-containing protein [Caulobacteraceae bacterium]|jgi:transcriptional regulator with XRE-family HTH domain
MIFVHAMRIVRTWPVDALRYAWIEPAKQMGSTMPDKHSRSFLARRASRDDPFRGARLSAAMFRDGRVYNCQLCYDLGVTESSLSRWRSGGPMSVAMTMALAQKLGISIDWLILGREPDDDDPTAPAPGLEEVAQLFAAILPSDKSVVLALGEELSKRNGIVADVGQFATATAG